MREEDNRPGCGSRPLGTVRPVAYRGKRLVPVDPNTMAIVPTRISVLRSLVLPVLSLVVFVAATCAMATARLDLGYSFALATAGLGGTAWGILLAWHRNGATTFSLRDGLYWTNHRLHGPRVFGRFAGDIDNIAALQLCRGSRVVTRTRFFRYYELNLILVDPLDERFCLMSHGATGAARDDAVRLAEFLGKPLLDHTGTGTGGK